MGICEMSKTAIIYCRQSSGKEEDSESIAFQEESCRAFAQARNIKVISVFSDANTPGRLYPTGAEELAELDYALLNWQRKHTTDKRFRSGLGDAIKAMPGVDYLLVYDLTRLYRPVQDSYLPAYINHKLSDSSVTLISIKEGKIDFSNFTDSLVSSIKSQVNDNQIALTREKSKKAMARLQDDGFYPTMPKMYGVRYLGGKNRAIELIPEQVEVVRYVYDRVLKRCKYSELLKDLNGKFKERVDGKCFYDSSWRHIIKNPFYCGYMYDSHGALIPAKQMQGKEIITYEEWKKANEIVNDLRKNPRERTHATHPFSGLMFCGNCGSKMSIILDNGKIGYSCLQGVNARSDNGCRKSRTNISLVRKSQDYTGLQEAITPLLLLAMYKELEKQSRTARIKRLIEEKEVQIANYNSKLNEIVSEYAEGGKMCAAFRAAYEKIDEKLTKIKNELTELNKDLEASGDLEKKAMEYLKMVPRVMENKLEVHEFTDLLHRSIKQIFCFEDRLEIKTVYGDFVLKRYMIHRFRNFPRFTYNVVSIGKNQKITNLNDCRIDVTYIYDNNEKQKLVVDLSVMKIYEK